MQPSNAQQTTPAVSKLGFLGGSFDPVHTGHIELARAGIAQLGLRRVYFIPAGQAPLKGAVCAGAQHRLAMLKLALEGEKNMEILDWEIETGGVSYTIETARRLRARWPQARLFRLIGADQLEQLDKWKHIDKLAKLVEFACAAREGYADAPPPNLPADLKLHRLENIRLPQSSSRARHACALGADTEILLPCNVNRYIKEHKLYCE